MLVKKFEKTDTQVWNLFLESSKNSSFLMNRSYMEYHSDRFTDFSLMVYDEKQNLVACFPANEKNSNEIVSHGGLTYGGIIAAKDIKLPVFMDVYRNILAYYEENGYSKITYKAIPRIFHEYPADEIEYCTFVSGAKLIRRDVALVVDLQNRLKISGNYHREAKKALKAGYQVLESDDMSMFWKEILTPNLKERYGVQPVHTTDEMELLKSRFPDNIRLYEVRSSNGKIVAGTVLFLFGNVVHCQYISSNDEGRSAGALNLLFVHLMDTTFKNEKYFDFGIVNENQGLDINLGMLAWKERMGGRAVSHDFYSIETASHQNFNQYFR